MAGGLGGARTRDLRTASAVRSLLRYKPIKVIGDVRVAQAAPPCGGHQELNLEPAYLQYAALPMSYVYAHAVRARPRSTGAARRPRTDSHLFTRQTHVHLCLSGIGAPTGFRSPYSCSTNSDDPISPPGRCLKDEG